MNLRALLKVSAPVFTIALLQGCGNGTPKPSASSPSGTLTGSVHGGQQPVAGATIQLYAVGTTEDGSAAKALLTVPVLTTQSGGFTIPADSCSGASQVYLTATGGNPGLSTSNSNLALMTALGTCDSLSASTFINVNELTTVAATAALAPYMTSLSAVGASPADAAALANAFALSSEMVDPGTGTSPGSNVPAGLSVPTAELATLANIISSCVNSAGGVAGDKSMCGMLFALTTPADGTAPANTIEALRNIAYNPSLNTSALFSLATANGPYQPQLTMAPPDFSVKLTPVPASPALSISPSGLVFTKTAIGFTSPVQPVTITNTGTTAVTITNISIAGTSAADYAQSNNCSSLTSGASCTVQVSLTPTAQGVRNATLVVASAVPGSMQTVALSGEGGTPSAGPISLSVSSLGFTVAGTIKDFNVQNFGNTPLTIRKVTISDPTFVVETNGCGTLLAAQSVCTISVQSNGFTSTNTTTTPYNPSYSGTLTVDDDATSGSQTLGLSSTNTSSVSTTTSGYGTWPVGSTQTSNSINAGGAPYRGGGNFSLISFSAVISGSNANDFLVGSCTTAASTGSCSMPITFTPSGVGPRKAIATINGSGYVRLSGTGAAAGPSATATYVPSSYSQGAAVTNAYQIATATETYTIQNNGTTSLRLSFTPVGGDAAKYKTSSNCPDPLASKATCSLMVTFTSSTVGKFASTIAIADANSAYVLSLPITTQAYYPIVSGSPNQLGFPGTPIGSSSAPLSFTMQNGNVGGLLGDGVTISTPSTGVFSTNVTSCPTSPTVACVVQVIFTPAAAGNYTDSLTITDVLSGNTGKVMVYGTGINPAVSLSTASLIFPARAVGSASVPMNVTLTNSGTTTLTVSGVSVVGASQSNFTLTNNCTGVAAGATCTIGVSFAPTTAGSQSATVRIVSNAASSPNTVALMGGAF